MAYHSISQMAQSSSLVSRVTACAAQENKPNTDAWVRERMLKICSTADWVTTWDYAVETYNVNMNPDTGARTDVISDAMILSVVQSMA